ncbi:hypothetical protein NEOC95_001973 [Neochlamydia sp. AcF95]|nr:hypothetical protein [Neochlamydia sp. AcF95]
MQKILDKRNYKLPTNYMYHFCQKTYSLCLADKVLMQILHSSIF